MDDDLAIDEDLTLLQRVVRYTSSAVSVQRLVYCRELGACAEQVGAPTALAELVPLLKPLGADPEPPVRHALAEQIVAFARVLLADPDATAAPHGDASTQKTSSKCPGSVPRAAANLRVLVVTFFASEPGTPSSAALQTFRVLSLDAETTNRESGAQAKA